MAKLVTLAGVAGGPGAWHRRRMLRPKVRVVLGDPQDQPGDLVVMPARHAGVREPRTVLVEAPRWDLPGGSEVALANAYRSAMAVAAERQARSVVIPAALSRGPWPPENLTRIAMTVLMSTPGPVREIIVAAPTPSILEVWAEAIIREGPTPGSDDTVPHLRG